MVLQLASSVSVDYMDTAEPIAAQHYAFLIEESEFVETFSPNSRRGVDSLG
jgi:hypothetical protein